MARKRRTELPGSESSESHTGGGRGDIQRPPAQQLPAQQQLQSQQPQQQRYQGGGRGLVPQRGAYGGHGGRTAPQPYYGGPPEYQGQNRGGQQYGRGGAPQRGAFVGGCDAPSAGGPSRPPAPELHQATQSPYQGVMTNPGSYGRPVEIQLQSQQPQQQGYQGGIRGLVPQRGAYGGHGGRTAPQPYYGGPPEYQGHSRGGQQYGRGGAPRRGAFVGGCDAPSAGGPSCPPAPELHQATQSPYQGVMTSPGSYGRPVETLSEASSSVQAPDPTHNSILSERIQQISFQQKVAPDQHMQPASSKLMRFPLRPGKGSYGTRCMVKANHFFVELPDKDLHKYDVTITPEVTSRGVNRAVMKQLIKLHKEILGNRLPAYDGQKSLYTSGPMPFVDRDFSVPLIDEEYGPGGVRREREFKVIIKFVARVDLHHLGMFLQGRRADAPQEALQVLDIVLRELPTSRPRYCPVGRSFYSPDLGIKSLGERLQSWNGFYQSIRPTQMGLSLNLDMSSSAFIDPLPVIDFIAQLLNRDLSARPLSDADCVKIKKALRGVKVEVTHRRNMRRKYRISGLTSLATCDLTFPVDESGTMKSVVEYFQETYDFVIQHRRWPCLQVGNTQRPNYLPMEVCKIVEGQRYSKRLNEQQITALLEVTCQEPRKREEDILQTVCNNKYAEDDYANEFGIKISEKLAQVEARVLPAPWLKYHESGCQKDCLPKVGQWNMRDKKMVNGGTVNSWTCINFATNVQNDVALKFCRKLAEICVSFGMVFSELPVLPVQSGHPDQVERVLNDVMTKLHPQKELDLLIVILPNNNGSLYGDLKRIYETNLGIVSQCCLQKYVHSPNKQYLANVSLKINVKVGGRNTVLVDALSGRIPLVSHQPTIIFGADVTHPHPGEDSSPSIAAVVASQDWPEVTKYAGLVCAQTHRQELIQDLYKTWHDREKGTMHGGMIKDLLISFHKATGHKPQRIIFYRDGVSEGQFRQVLRHELDSIRKACASLERNYQPTVTFVAVQKRHHTRLFANKSGNVLPGTVVYSKICHPSEFDFYLCSHAGVRGTSRPAHYHVLWDENKFSADALQSLTNNLCYTYARCTRSVSIVPPAYYAHLAAFRARFYMEPETPDSGLMTSSAVGRGAGARTTRAAGANAAVRPLPELKENIKRVMFYC